ncbi:MAG TPA: site-specific integrase, partial [Lachnospiraceae bacterium]|nr:site-specific integrase [Lachnospiraceae bacterium]
MANRVRKDPRGRIFRKGEGYRIDKKLYIFQYVDPVGKPHTLYAKDMVELRQKEEAIEKDRMDGIKTYLAGQTTLNYGFDRYISLKYDLKPSTKANYLYIYDRFVRDGFGRKLLKDIRYS